MSSKPYPVGEARRLLPHLIELAASGKGPIYMGRRGRAEVALVAVADSQSPRVRRPLVGLVEFEAASALSQGEDDLRKAFESSLKRTEKQVLGASKILQPQPLSKRARVKPRP